MPAEKPRPLNLHAQRPKLGKQALSGLVRVGELGKIVGGVVVPLHQGRGVALVDNLPLVQIKMTGEAFALQIAHKISDIIC